MAVFIAAILHGVGRSRRPIDQHPERFRGNENALLLADLISFGLAPALVMYHWALLAMKMDGVTPGKIGWIAAFLYAACAALRLARFNSQVGQVDKRWFIGRRAPRRQGW